jgi:hypothetical protein
LEIVPALPVGVISPKQKVMVTSHASDDKVEKSVSPRGSPERSMSDVPSAAITLYPEEISFLLQAKVDFEIVPALPVGVISPKQKVMDTSHIYDDEVEKFVSPRGSPERSMSAAPSAVPSMVSTDIDRAAVLELYQENLDRVVESIKGYIGTQI